MKHILSIKYLSAFYQVLFLLIGLLTSKKMNPSIKFKYLLLFNAAVNQFFTNYIIKQFKKSAYTPEKKMKVPFREITNIRSHLLAKFEQANIDHLTSIYNRKAFDKDLKSLDCEYLSVVMIDADHFKNINDTYGHEEGDRVLKEIGKLVNEVAGEQGTAYRYGGEEFILLLPDMKKQKAFLLARTLRYSVENMISIQGNPVTVSLGVASGKHFKKLISQSDKALYKSKKRGRNCVS